MDGFNVRPQALQSVFGPEGPLRHSGESRVPAWKEISIRVCIGSSSSDDTKRKSYRNLYTHIHRRP